MYNKIINMKDKDKHDLYRMSIIFKKELMAAIYLSVI